MAGIEVVSEFASPLLQRSAALGQLASLPVGCGSWRQVDGCLLDAPMTVQLRRDQHVSDLEFADGTHARIASDGALIDVLQIGTSFTPVLWGPLLLLALARFDVYCLHASAYLPVDRATGARLVLGPSGVGKSSLAHVAHGRVGSALVDDLCPVRLDTHGQAYVLPRFPQLKWRTDQHWANDESSELAVTRIGLLGRGEETKLMPATASECLRALLSHTVAARLFDPEQLLRHFSFCTALLAATKGEHWIARDALADPAGAILELLQQIECSH